MRSSAELQALLVRLEADQRSAGKRNRLLAVAFAEGLVLLRVVLAALHRTTIGSYAELAHVIVRQHPASQGRLVADLVAETGVR
ncbi:MAG TPA: hypothetical protein EYP56_07830 [Planctomycetaceae bacterium]|nr:hypothetical protein [Planctomycetaceae bacterium]HIQ19877.1 hypothetical protein [Planctomycetota bacterium]